jgi:chitodextrinase
MDWKAATDNVSVDHYDIYRDLIKIGTTKTLAYTDSTVLANKTVKYMVMGVDEVGNSGIGSNQVQVITDVQSPTPPTGLRVTATTASSISLGWSASTDNYAVTAYDIYRNNVKVATQSAATGTTFYSGGLASGTTYTYYVKARDPSDNVSPDSNDATSTTSGTGGGDNQAPTTPTSVAAKPLSGSVKVTWNASSDNVGVTAYAVLRNGIAITTTATGTSWSDPSPPLNTNVSYAVKARDAAANWSSSSSSSTAFVDTIRPSTPAGVTAKVASGKVTLTWRACTDNRAVATYVIRRNGFVVATVRAGTLTWTDASPPKNVTLKYTIQAKDAAGNHSFLSTAVAVKVT